MRHLSILAAASLLAGCAGQGSLGTLPTPAHHHRPIAGHPTKVLASWYGGAADAHELNSHTANGERFRADGFTAAHRTMAFGTMLSVCYRGCATVRVNDRGPAAWTRRSLDLSRGAARAIGLVKAGVANVDVAVVGR